MILTTYNVATPQGAFTANWDEDESLPVVYTGDADAIAFFKTYLDTSTVAARGLTLTFDSLEPDQIEFCISRELGIDVRDADEQDNDMQQIFDSASDADTFALIGEGAQLLAGLDENDPAFFDNLRRLREIVLALGSDTPAVIEPEPTPEPAPEPLPAYAYATLEDFAADYEAMGEIGRAAMVYAGMGTSFATQQMSLRQVLDAITDDRMSEFRLDPYTTREANLYSDLKSAKHFLLSLTRDNATMLDKIRGPWAAKMVDFCAPQGEVSLHPDLFPLRAKDFVLYSKAYKALKRPAKPVEPAPIVEPTPTPEPVIINPEPAPPGAEPEAIDMEKYIKVADDSIAALRRVHVYRVLSELAADNVDGVTRAMLAQYIINNRPDLASEVVSVMAEEWPGELADVGETVTPEPMPAVDPVVDLVQPLPEGGAVVPPAAGEEPDENPQRTADLSYLADVQAKNVDLWADDTVADRIEAIATTYAGDEQVEAAVRAAIDTYTEFMTNALAEAV